AVIAENQLLGSGVLELAAALGLRVPGDLSVAVLGDPMLASETAPELTTFLIPREEMGVQAVRLLARMLAGPARGPLQLVLPCVFKPGATTGPAPEKTAGLLAGRA
ncbi:MAG TPA: substrate-binding domain-containing protein, partial [Deinococcales bacterium]|nr:substrate-binding domain-containing protein [Deinococcales bacterium]